MRATAFDRLMSSLEHPMAVVTAATRRESSGCLVGFWTRCSLDPVRLCVFISRQNHTHGVARRASHLLVHFLDHRQHDLARHFGSHAGHPDVEEQPDTFAGVGWRPGPDGRTPKLDGVDAWVLGRVRDRVDGGDHEGFVLEPVRARSPRRFRQLGSREVRDIVPSR
jgi:flavin reductase (DIM6/NTAB) family NADH-FMN oxidoreductase RutF